jgi:adhesin transport system membrane fusion protein
MASAIARLDAELAGGEPSFPSELQDQASDLVAEQRTLWLNRKRERDDALETVRRQVSQRQQELAEAKARASSLANLLESTRETLAIEEKLQSQGAGAMVDLLRARQEVTRIQSELDSARISIPRIQASIQEAQSRTAEVMSKYRADASRERSELEAKRAALGEQITASEDRVSRRELRSPMDGVVNRLLINTVGGVAKAGETIMELIPVQDRLQISARVKPSDIAFIRPGQPAKIRITAYDSSIFGSLEGKVLRVGADAVLDEKQENLYFEVVLETDRNYLGKSEERLTISPGMAADASINTGKRTLMEYMLKPVVKTLDKSLRER